MTDICADQDMEGNALLTIDRYVKAQSLKEAYELCQNAVTSCQKGKTNGYKFILFKSNIS